MKKYQSLSPRELIHRFYNSAMLMSVLLLCNSLQELYGQENRYKGLRPYELDWAGRYEDDHVPLIDFEKEEAWSVDASDGSATINRSKEEIIWGDYTYKMSYRANSTDASFVIYPPDAVKIPDTFTALNLWVCGNYWIWNDHERKRPISKFSILLETNSGESFEIPFRRDLDFGRWYLMHIRLTAEEQTAFADGGVFKGFRLTNCLPDKEDVLFFDNLSFFTEDLTSPLEYDILPRPGVDLAPGQDLGVHTGEERLPFPTREETILPENVSKDYTNDVYRDG